MKTQVDGLVGGCSKSLTIRSRLWRARMNASEGGRSAAALVDILDVGSVTPTAALLVGRGVSSGGCARFRRFTEPRLA